MCRRFSSLCALAAVALALTACATRVEVRSVGSADPSQAFYDMRGHQLVSLHERAEELCPKGYTVLRQAQTGLAADPRAGLPSKAGMMAADFLWPAGEGSAQLLVQCVSGMPASPR